MSTCLPAAVHDPSELAVGGFLARYREPTAGPTVAICGASGSGAPTTSWNRWPVKRPHGQDGGVFVANGPPWTETSREPAAPVAHHQACKSP
jgi:hypothetical protein